MRNTYNILAGKPRRGWEVNIRMDLREKGGKLWSGFI
jgi:hypothetical protein